jgi:hypothetical protein
MGLLVRVGALAPIPREADSSHLEGLEASSSRVYDLDNASHLLTNGGISE